MKNFILLLIGLFLGSGSLFAQNFQYVGAKKCKMCHNKPASGMQYKKWTESKHSHAMESLSIEEAKDPACIKCHSTYGGVESRLITTLKITEGVSCESCHGPGSKYNPSSVMKNRDRAKAKGLQIPNEKTCTACHNSECEHYKAFNYKEYVAKIAHPKPKA